MFTFIFLSLNTEKEQSLVVSGNGLGDMFNFDSRTAKECNFRSYHLRNIKTGGSINRFYVGYMKGKIVTCTSSKTCHRLNDNRWSQFGTMVDKRDYGASIVINDNTLFIIGGKNLKSTEFVNTDDGHAVPGPELDQVWYEGCFVKIGCSSAIRYAGRHLDKNFFTRTTVYNIDKKEWGVGPEINIVRINPVCGIVHDSGTSLGIKYIILAGGRTEKYNYKPTSAVEVLPIENEQEPKNLKWIEVSPLPFAVFLGSTATSIDGKSLIVISGMYVDFQPSGGIIISDTDIMYKIQCSSKNCFTSVLPTLMSLKAPNSIVVFQPYACGNKVY